MSAATGAVTLMQRFGSDLNLNLHFHMLVLDGVYGQQGPSLRFVPVPAPMVRRLRGGRAVTNRAVPGRLYWI